MVSFLPKPNNQPVFVNFLATNLGTALVRTCKSGILSIDLNDNPRTASELLKSHYASEEHLFEVNQSYEDVQQFFCDQLAQDFTVCVTGTPFQMRVWKAITEIPSGSTVTYAQLAQSLQLPATAARAIGSAVAQNPVAIIVPCHRVVPANGHLTGFRWGTERKRQLLQQEGALLF